LYLKGFVCIALHGGAPVFAFNGCKTFIVDSIPPRASKSRTV
jgi:hypothetical protein